MTRPHSNLNNITWSFINTVLAQTLNFNKTLGAELLIAEGKDAPRGHYTSSQANLELFITAVWIW